MVQVSHKQLDLQITNSHTFFNTTTKTCTKINSYLKAPYTRGSLNSSFHSPIIYTWAVFKWPSQPLTGHLTHQVVMLKPRN